MMENYTPEQRAIRQFLSKPEPVLHGCGCMGPQLIHDAPKPPGLSWNTEQDEYEIVISDFGPKKLEVMKLIRASSSHKLSLTEIKKLLAGTSATLQRTPWIVDQELVDGLRRVGATVTVNKYSPMREPLCPCAMRYVELVDGNYYYVSSHRSPDGITHKAEFVGPRGGPYIS